MSLKQYSDSELKKDVLGAAISKESGYNEEIWVYEGPLSSTEYNKIGIANCITVKTRFSSENQPRDGWNNLKKELGIEIRNKSFSDEQLKKDVLGAAISKESGYNEEIWATDGPLINSEYDKIGKASSSTIATRFSSEDTPRDGWKNLKKELGLELHLKKYDTEEIIERLKEQSEDGITAPHVDELKKPSKHVYSEKETDLFETVLDAIWLAGLVPYGSWSRGGKYQDEIDSEFRNLTSDAYWAGDPELGKKRFDVTEDMRSPYLNPKLKFIGDNAGEFFSEFSLNQSEEENPWVRIGKRKHTIDRKSQDLFMKKLQESENYLELLELDERINNRINPDFFIEQMLDPLANPEDGGSFGRWMSQDEFPNGVLEFLYGADPRPTPEEAKNLQRARKTKKEIRKKEQELRNKRRQ